MTRAKKSLGQNFLKSGKALADIVSAGEINQKDTVLEIGPGKGALTEKLLKEAGYVVAVEKDRELAEFLREKFSSEIKTGKLKLIEGDILEFNFDDLKAKSYKLVANIPYYITGAILRKFLETDRQPERIVLLVQKEVAERVVARDGKESVLSVSVRAYGNPKYISKVPARYFSPAPKVGSAILLISNISKKMFTENNIQEKDFFELVKAGFAHKRKLLSSNLKSLRHPISELKICKIPEKSRAEDLKIEDWLCLAKKLST